jgi:hypothetical protein
MGSLNCRARRLFRCHAKTNRGLPRTKTEAAGDMIQAWQERTESLVWEGYDFDEEWEIK